MGFLENILGSQHLAWCATILVLSMIPGIGGPMMMVPLGTALGLPVFTSAAMCMIGNIIPVPIIIIFVRAVFSWMRKVSKRLGSLADKFEEKAKTKGAKFRRGMFAGLLIFVAIPLPLPGMGAATAALIAAIFDIRLRLALPAIAIGVLIATSIATAVTLGFITFIL